MVASAFVVTLPSSGGQTKYQDSDMVVCWAESSAAAIAIAKASIGFDANSSWDGATATPVVVGTELEGWTFSVYLKDPVTPFAELNASFVGLNAAVIDDIGTGLAAALVAAGIAGAAYNTGTNVLTIVETTDSMGDWFISVKATPPAAGVGSSGSFGDGTIDVVGFFGAVTAAGAAGIARTSTLVASVPKVYAVGKITR